MSTVQRPYWEDRAVRAERRASELGAENARLRTENESLNDQLDAGAKFDEQREEWLAAALSAITDGDRYAALPVALRDWWIGRSETTGGKDR
jgi:hypothetical protein